LKKQQEYIQSSLLERDKETKKLIAATEQEEKEGRNFGGSFGNSVLKDI